jgi:hypothetical protein
LGRSWSNDKKENDDVVDDDDMEWVLRNADVKR